MPRLLHDTLATAASICCCALLLVAVTAQPEPYPYLHHCNATALPSRPLSPDPLVRYRWDGDGCDGSTDVGNGGHGIDYKEVQIYASPPESWGSDPPDAFRVTKAKARKSESRHVDGMHVNVEIWAPGTLTLDFGVERAGWFEFDSDDLSSSKDDDDDNELLSLLSCSLSEFNLPLEDKTKVPVRYDDSHTSTSASYRLETNEELYEGIRFAFIMFNPPKDHTVTYPIRLTNVRVVGRVRPVSYAAHYASSSNLLTRVWYTGAYGVRLNMHQDDFGTVLIERGDRVAIQGDQHPTIAAALTAFGDGSTAGGRAVYELIRSSLNRTDSGCDGCHVVDDGIMSYPILWAMSVLDYYWSTGDADTLAHYRHDVMNILDRASKIFYPEKPNIAWQGWDDRLDDGWCGPCSDEAQLTFATLLVRAYTDFVATLIASGRDEWADDAARYASKAKEMSERLTSQPNWSDAYGLHASANAINAALPSLDKDLIERLFDREFDDIVKICSYAPFNQYWILQAMGNANKMDHALASIRLCWGTMTKVTKGCFLELFDHRWFEEWIVRRNGSKVPGPPSYCHPWSSGVTHWLTEAHVGIRPLRPGYEEALISPFASTLNPSVDGSVGTPFGPIEVETSLNSNERIVRVRVLSPVKARIAFRKFLDGCVLTAMSFESNEMPGSEQILQSDDLGFGHRLHPQFMSTVGFSRLLQPGHHVVLGKYSGCIDMGGQISKMRSDSPYPPFPPVDYPASTQMDITTHGNWKGNYGADGYILFGFNNGTDVTKLPTYVGNVSKYYMWGGGPHDPANHFRGRSKTDASYLESPSDEEKWRALGSIGNEVSAGRGLVVDIPITENADSEHVYRVSVYMVTQAANNEFVIKAMDYSTRSSIAPLVSIQNHTNGIYWSIEYTSGVRLRLAPMYGATTISAVFFDRVKTK